MGAEKFGDYVPSALPGRGGMGEVGWIVLADGEQVGIRQGGESVSPAPTPDPTARTTTADGATVQADPFDPAPGSGR